jgi:hypothetical protein
MANVVMINKTLIELNYFIFPTRGERELVCTLKSIKQREAYQQSQHVTVLKLMMIMIK